MDPDRLIQWMPQQGMSIYSPNRSEQDRVAACCLAAHFVFRYINRWKTFALECNTVQTKLVLSPNSACMPLPVHLPVRLPVSVSNMMLGWFMSLQEKNRITDLHSRDQYWRVMWLFLLWLTHLYWPLCEYWIDTNASTKTKTKTVI